MNKGFGNSTQTVDQLIKNQIKQNKFLCSEVSNGFRRIYEEPMWSYIPTFRKHVSKEDVVNPYKNYLREAYKVSLKRNFSINHPWKSLPKKYSPTGKIPTVFLWPFFAFFSLSFLFIKTSP